ncbi:hypothetical protein PHMEG_0007946 [Phytophthora megakarya]|uniref:Uncharacterized protein n=1 Tax=Phytophthora megakarya TaxID=4795 RepID=A0A225WLY8_9STRA|nr:hypothetical protein PHMEG_0007946 [Phytophthora megakarya]
MIVNHGYYEDYNEIVEDNGLQGVTVKYDDVFDLILQHANVQQRFHLFSQNYAVKTLPNR